ncbi:MAG TPA: hypothetical protein VE988_18700, partial [Gemmataceae bacterium]|nr:hypothetical protein [Gemmataceae bacterium]
KSIWIGWTGFRDKLLGKDLGTRFVLLSRALSVASECIEEIYEAMNSVFVGPAERQVASFRDGSGREVLVGELLSWVMDFTSDDAPRLVHEGGRRGAEAVIPTAKTLAELIRRLIQAISFEFDLPEGMRQPRVLNPLRELQGHLNRIKQLATEVRQS